MARITLGVSGGIGAYKAVEVVRGLQKAGHDVTVVMTRSARRFVGELTFEAITRRRVVSSQWAPGLNADIEHIALATSSDLLLVVPATANVIAKFAHGIADDFLTSLYLATTAPVLLAPAMNTHMLEHPAVQANLAALAARGVQFVEPGEGYLACGWVGKGRLAEPEDVVAAVQRRLGGTALAGRAVVVTAGPTFEDIDPVRFVGNRSSGRMGYAVAQEAARRGAAVVLVTGPTHLDPPPGVDVVRVRSAAEMHRAVMDRAAGADAVIMAAAVADYTPEAVEPQKVAKKDGGWSLPLVRTIDILAELGKLPSRATGPAGAGRLCRRDPRRPGARRRQAAAQGRRPDRRQRRLAVRRRLRGRHQRGDLRQRRGPGAPAAAVEGRGRRADPRSPRAPARRGVRPDGGPMTRDDLQAHVEYFRELGVTGVNRQPEWRTREASAPAPALAGAAPPGAADAVADAAGRQRRPRRWPR